MRWRNSFRRSFTGRFVREFNAVAQDPLTVVVGTCCATALVRVIGQAAEGLVRAVGDAAAKVVNARHQEYRPA